MAAYYSENDPFAAAWLRELIKDNLIADGEVDERSILDVSADDVRGFTQCHFFAGIGGWSYALRLAGWADDRFVWTGSAPCQPFSAAGAQAGGHDPRDLWPVWFQLIKKCRPGVVFGEQVEAAIGHGWLDRVCDDLEAEGYAVGACSLPAASVGAFHIRQRLWFVGELAYCEANGLEGRYDIGGLRQESATNSATRGLADTEYRGGIGRLLHGSSESDGADRGGASGQPEGSSDVDELADAEHPERGPLSGPLEDERDGRDAGRPQAHRESGTCGEVRNVADADRTGSNRQRREGLSGDSHASQRHDADGCGESGDLGHAASVRFSRIGGSGAAQVQRTTESSNANFWSDVIWLPCSDGKARPVKPGIFPLASGISNRVGILRGAGNAICPQVAAEFIAAYMDC